MCLLEHVLPVLAWGGELVIRQSVYCLCVLGAGELVIRACTAGACLGHPCLAMQLCAVVCCRHKPLLLLLLTWLGVRVLDAICPCVSWGWECWLAAGVSDLF